MAQSEEESLKTLAIFNLFKTMDTNRNLYNGNGICTKSPELTTTASNIKFGTYSQAICYEGLKTFVGTLGEPLCRQIYDVCDNWNLEKFQELCKNAEFDKNLSFLMPQKMATPFKFGFDFCTLTINQFKNWPIFHKCLFLVHTFDVGEFVTSTQTKNLYLVVGKKIPSFSDSCLYRCLFYFSQLHQRSEVIMYGHWLNKL